MDKVARQIEELYAAGQRDFRGWDLRGRAFSGLNLTGANFTGCDCRGADFSGATLNRVKFDQCDARGALFNGAGLGLARFWRADISGAVFQGAYIYGARALGAKADHADFSDVRGATAENMLGGPDTALAEARRHVQIDAAGGVRVNPEMTEGRRPAFRQEDVDFLRRERIMACLAAGQPRTANGMVDFKGYDFSGLDLSGLDMSNCDLSGAKFHRTDMRRTKLMGSVLYRAELVAADLSEADASACYICEAEIVGCRARDTVFDECDIRDTAVLASDLAGARFERAHMRRNRFVAPDLQREAADAGRRLDTPFYTQMPGATFAESLVEECRFSERQLAEGNFDGAAYTPPPAGREESRPAPRAAPERQAEETLPHL